MKTIISLQKHIKSGTMNNKYKFRDIAKRIKCKDGTSLSVQASRTHYCIPRDNIGPYTHVEVGYPSRKPPKTWKSYCEEWGCPKDTIYAYVPIELVAKWIDLHQGI